jgi:tetratricopeptide (TPR) repeat protein
VLEEGLERTSKLKEAFSKPELTQAEKLDKWRLMLDRAQMLITLGNVTPDPEFLYSQAQKELERMASEAGETTGPGLNAFLALAKLYRQRGMYVPAFDFAHFVATTAVPVDGAAPEWKDVPFEAKAERFKLVEFATPDLVESLAAAGQTAKSTEWALYYFNVWRREGFELSPYGYRALLSAARTLMDAGGHVGGSMTQGNLRWFETEEDMSKAGFSARDSRSALDLALSTAQEVNDANKGNVLQVRAQKLIADVISRPGVVVSPEVLVQAAEGEYNSASAPAEYVAAIDACKNVMRALESRDEATQREYMPKALYLTGRSFSKLGRPLEAAMAYRDVVTTWKGDPEIQPLAAQGYYSEIGAVRRAASGDKLIEEKYLEAERILIESQKEGQSGAEVVKWRQGERAYDQKKYDDARKSYLTVGPSADEHEKAIVKAALCLYQVNDKDAAAKEFDAYLTKFVADPRNAITGTRKLAARDEARAQATYYLGKMAFDAQEYAEAIRHLSGYEQKFPEQNDYAPRALYMVALSQLAQLDLAGAKATAATLEKTYPTSTFTGRTAFAVFQHLKAEQEKAEKAGDLAQSRALEQEMAHQVRVSNRTATEPSFANLRVESTLWLDIGDWKAAEETLTATVKAFEADAARAEDLEKFVLPDLGRALLGQQRVPEAFAVLDPLVPKDDSDPRKPSSSVVRDWSRALAGWVEGDASKVVEVPGVGGDFKRAVDLTLKLADQEKDKWTCPWYELKFAQAYALLQWSKIDSTQRDVAKRVVDDIASQLGDPDMKGIAEECGDDVLRKRFLWLRNELR